MAFENVIATANYLRNDGSSVPGLPLTVGCWCNMPAVGTTSRWIWMFSQAAAADQYASLKILANETVNISVRAAGAAAVDSAFATAAVAGEWFFTLIRYVSATSRRGAKLTLTGTNAGLIEHVQGTTSRNPSFDTVVVGATYNSSTPGNYLGGHVAEFWYTGTDIVESDIQTPDEIVRQIAFQGPFAYQPMIKDIIEYRSFRKDTYSGDIGNVYFGAGKGPQVWTAVNNPTIAPHVPTLTTYFSPKPAINHYRKVFPVLEPTGVAGRIFKLAGYGGGLVGPARGLVGKSRRKQMPPPPPTEVPNHVVG